MVQEVKLKQDQIWNLGDGYVLITHLERLEVQYKSFKNIANRKGAHHHISKKEFCKLIKHAILLTPEEARNARLQEPTTDEMPVIVPEKPSEPAADSGEIAS